MDRPSTVFKIITSWKGIKRVVEYCKQTKYCSFDFETTGFEYYEEYKHPTIIGISFQPGSAYVIPLAHFDSPFKDNYKEVLDYLGEHLFTNYEIIKVAWNLKFEYKWLFRYGIELKGRLFDGMLAKYCLDEERPMGLKEFVSRVFPWAGGYENNIGGPKKDWSKIPLDKLSKYCAIDCDYTLRAMLYMEPKLINLGFYPLFRNLLMMATRVLAESEYHGIRIDKEYLEKLMTDYEKQIAEVKSGLFKNPMAIKFQARERKKRNKELIEACNREIAEIEEGDSKQKARMISSRKTKINQIIAGTFKGKVGKLKAYEGLNFSSPDQMVDLLFRSRNGFRFKVLKYTQDKKTKKDTKRPSTDESVLVELSKLDGSGLIDNLLKLRELEKLYSTYIKGVYLLLSTKTRVHASFLIHGTVTGRLSCVDPNLQNIPRDTTASDIKKMYLPDPGHLLLEVDYGQAELRVLAEMAEDKAMIDIFSRGYNIHVATACKAHYKSLDKYDIVKGIIAKAEEFSGEELKQKGKEELLFWAKQKKKAKTVNFGIVYGQGDPKLAEGMGVPVEEAKEFKRDWFKAYPEAVAKIDSLQAYARKHGYVKNMFGRKRRLPDAMFKDKWEAKRYNMMGKYLEAMRQAVNSPIQGTGSDFALLSQIIVRKYRKLGWLPQGLIQLYTVHDSIGFSTDPQHLHWAVPIITNICDNPETKRYFGFSLKHVKMKVSQEVGINWGQLKGYDAWTNYTKLLNTKDSI